MPAPGEERFDELPHSQLPGGLTLIEAATGRTRRLGLARLDALHIDSGLHIPHCPLVHTFGMRFALDLLWLARDGSIVRIDRAIPPGRIRGCLRARSVLECNAGRADAFVAAAGQGAPLVLA